MFKCRLRVVAPARAVNLDGIHREILLKRVRTRQSADRCNPRAAIAPSALCFCAVNEATMQFTATDRKPSVRLGEELPVFCERCGYALHGMPQTRCAHCEIL